MGASALKAGSKLGSANGATGERGRTRGYGAEDRTGRGKGNLLKESQGQVIRAARAGGRQKG